jgi:hypothetical protein
MVSSFKATVCDYPLCLSRFGEGDAVRPHFGDRTDQVVFKSGNFKSAERFFAGGPLERNEFS